MTQLKQLAVGVAGMGGVELASQLQVPTSTEVKDIVSVIVQVVIGIATLIGLFKKRVPKP